MMRIPTRSALLVACCAVVLSAQAVTVSIDYQLDPTCSGNNGKIYISYYGGTAPWTFLWSDGSTEEDRTGLGAGTYTVTVTDGSGGQGTVNCTLVQQDHLSPAGFSFAIDGHAYFPCPGMTDGRIRVPVYPWPEQNFPGIAATPPIWVQADADNVPLTPLGTTTTGDPIFGYLHSGQLVHMTYMDANGCTAEFYQQAEGPTPQALAVEDVVPSCGGNANGSIAFEDVGGFQGWAGAVRVYNDQSTLVGTLQPFSQPWMVGSLAAGTYTAEILYGGTTDPTCEGEFLPPITVPDLGTECGVVSGSVFLDHDQNCVRGGADQGIPNRLITFLPGPQYALTDAQGNFSRPFANGNYTASVQGTGTDLQPLCPAVQPAPFTVNNLPVTVNIADSSLVDMDLHVWLCSTTARPGFVSYMHCSIMNEGGQLSGPIEATLTIDPAQSFISAEPVPTSVAGNVLTWSLPSLVGFAGEQFVVYVQTPADASLLGTVITHSFTVASTVTDVDPTNNTASYTQTITGSFDPNEKTVRTSNGSDAVYLIDHDSYLDYAVHFQNTGTDTAFNVVVTDTLSAALDMASFEHGQASHPFTVQFKPGRVVEWHFDHILLPDSGTDEAASHGLIQFRIKPVQPLVAGTLISNHADIFFDFNAPVRTNNADLVADFSTAVAATIGATGPLTIYPNPAQDAITLRSDAGVLSQVRIISMDGRCVLQPLGSGELMHMDTSSLSAGCYSVMALTTNGTALRTTFIIH